MDIFAASMLFVVLILIYCVIAEFFTVMFRFTGLPREKARFQVVSLLTGSGFTTQESELVVATRTRRKLGRITMLFGYVFNITIVATFVNVFLSLKQAEMTQIVRGLPGPILIFLIIFVLQWNPRVRAGEVHFVERIAKRFSRRSGNTITLVDYLGGKAIAHITLRELPCGFSETPLSQTGLQPQHGILVLLLERAGSKPEAVRGSTVLQQGDMLTVFGPLTAIEKAFEAKECIYDEG